MPYEVIRKGDGKTPHHCVLPNKRQIKRTSLTHGALVRCTVCQTQWELYEGQWMCAGLAKD